MNELETMLRLAGLTSGVTPEPKKVKSLNEALNDVIKTETIKAEISISTGHKLLKELSEYSKQPITKSTIMESAGMYSANDKDLLKKLIKESVKYHDKDGIKAQITTKILGMMEKYKFNNPVEMIIAFGGTVIQGKDGNTVTW